MYQQRIAPPENEKAFTLEVSYLRGVLRLYRAYDQMGASEKRAFLWQLGEWRQYQNRVMDYRKLPMLHCPYAGIANQITMLLADMLAEKAGLPVIPSPALRLSDLERWIETLSGVEAMPNLWY